MRRYEIFNPTIPEDAERSKNETLPEYDITSNPNETKTTSTTSARSRRVKGTAKTVKKEKTAGTSINFNRVVEFFTSKTFRVISGLFLSLFAVYLAIAFISYFATCIKDQSEINNTAIGMAGDVANAAGEGGARMSEFLINEFFGIGSFVIIVWLIAIGLRLLSGKPRFKPVNFTIKCLVALITVSLIVGLITIGAQTSVNWGGYHGRYVNEFIVHFLGWSGAVILCIFMLSCFVIICMRDVVKWILKKKAEYDEKRRIRREELAAQRARERELEEMRRAEDRVEGPDHDNAEDSENETDKGFEMNFGGDDQGLYQDIPGLEDSEYAYNKLDIRKDGEENSSEGEDETSKEGEENPDDVNAGTEDDSRKAAQAANIPKEHEVYMPADQVAERIKNGENPIEAGKEETEGREEPDMVVNVNTISEVKGKSQGIGNDSPEHFPYKFPAFELLTPGSASVNIDPAEQLANKEQIKKTLQDFDIPIVNIEATVGPTITLYEIVPDKGIRVAKIRSLADDIARSLAAEGVRIIAPIPGKSTVGIEVPNQVKQTVSMRTVLKSPSFQETKYKLPIAMGSTISNDVFVADLAKMPHLLVAGATGQGKSVGLNAIITSLLYSKRPDELKFVMIDPKMVEFSLYAKIEGHYLAKLSDAEDAIITDMDKVVATLSSLCVEMDNRYQLLKEAACRNLIEYNDKVKEKKLNPNDGHRFLPYIVVIVDEFSDLIMTAGKEVEMPIARLAQKARAVGMHVIIATQRPSTNVITGIIRANFPARMAFKVSSGVDSKIILDTTGAQQLIGRGDMLISNSAPMVRVQCAFIDTPEVEKICEHISRQPYAQGAYILPEPANGKGEGDIDMAGGAPGERDPLFEEVARLVVQTNNASTSSIQRRYRIGYNRAGSIMDQLESYGVVGPAQGGKPRTVLMDAMTLENLLESL